MVHPSVSDILARGLIPNFPGGFNDELFFFLMANIGTTIAPWMLFFQQSAVVDKGMQEKDIPWGKIRHGYLGSFFTVVVAIFIVIVTGTVLTGVEHRERRPGRRAAHGNRPLRRHIHGHRPVRRGPAGRDLHLAGEFLGVRRGVRLGALAQHKISEAPWFYAYYFFDSDRWPALVVLIPGAPLVLITLFVQVIAVTLLPAALVFLILLLNDRHTMGEYCNTSARTWWAASSYGDHCPVVPLRGQRPVPKPVPVSGELPMAASFRRMLQKIGDINQHYRNRVSDFEGGPGLAAGVARVPTVPGGLAGVQVRSARRLGDDGGCNAGTRMFSQRDPGAAGVHLEPRRVGRLGDMAIVETGRIPEVSHFIVERSFGYPSLLVPWSKISVISNTEIDVSDGDIDTLRERIPEGLILLKDHILDKKILDMDDHEVEVVYDVKLVLQNGKLYASEVDFSRNGCCGAWA